MPAVLKKELNGDRAPLRCPFEMPLWAFSRLLCVSPRQRHAPSASEDLRTARKGALDLSENPSSRRVARLDDQSGRDAALTSVPGTEYCSGCFHTSFTTTQCYIVRSSKCGYALAVILSAPFAPLVRVDGTF